MTHGIADAHVPFLIDMVNTSDLWLNRTMIIAALSVSLLLGFMINILFLNTPGLKGISRHWLSRLFFIVVGLAGGCALAVCVGWAVGVTVGVSDFCKTPQESFLMFVNETNLPLVRGYVECAAGMRFSPKWLCTARALLVCTPIFLCVQRNELPLIRDYVECAPGMSCFALSSVVRLWCMCAVRIVYAPIILRADVVCARSIALAWPKHWCASVARG